MILRNLTKHVYASGDALQALADERLHGCDPEDFGEVVMTLICWSSDPSCSMPSENNITRGIWAGHRFDITTPDTVAMGDGVGVGVKLTDVSDKVVKRLKYPFERGGVYVR